MLAILSRHRSAIDSHDVRRLALFGSVARDEARPDSDVDVFVEFAGTPTFAHCTDLKLLLEDILGRPVDLATDKALKPELRSSVEADMIDVR